MREPTVAIVTKAKATFFKALYEAFAQAQPAPWRTLVAWPDSRTSEHPSESVTPRGANLDIVAVRSRPVMIREGASNRAGPPLIGRSYLPSADLWRVLREHNVRAVLIHEYSPFTLGGLAYAWRHRIPLLVSSEIGRRNCEAFNWRTRLWHRFWGRFANGIVACCPAAMEPLSGGRRPTVSAYHAMDSRLCQPCEKSRMPGSPLVFAYLGQLIPRKGIDVLLQAAAILRDRAPGPFKIRLIGGGEVSWVQGWIQRLNLNQVVELAGFLSGDAIRDALGTADVFVLPTRFDTYAAVVHEAACMALPLLVSKHAGAAEGLVEDGVNGFTFEPGRVEEFAGILARFFDPELRARMGAQARLTAERSSAHERGRALWLWMESVFGLNAAASVSEHRRH